MSHFMRGGYNGGTRRGKPDIAPAMRAAFLAAVKRLKDEKGKSLPELMAEWLEKDPIAMLKVMSKFLPREARVRENHNHTLETAPLSETRDFSASVLEEKREEAESKGIDTRPVGIDSTRVK